MIRSLSRGAVEIDAIWIAFAAVIIACLWFSDRSEERCVNAGGDPTECHNRAVRENRATFGCSPDGK